MGRQHVTVADNVKIVSVAVPAAAGESIQSIISAAESTDWPGTRQRDVNNEWVEGATILQGILTPDANISLKDGVSGDVLTLLADIPKAIPAQDFGKLQIFDGAGTATLICEIYSQLDSGDK